MRYSIATSLIVLLLLGACSKHERPAKAALSAQQVLDRSEKMMKALKSMHYTMIYSTSVVESKDTTNSIYDILLEPLPQDPFGYRIFAQSMSGYHAVYDGDTAIVGVPASGMKIYPPSQKPAERLDHSFAGNTRISYVHGKTIFDGVRGSSNIKGMDVEDIRWNDAAASRLRIHFGERPPMMGGTLEIIFRTRDYFPVRVSETLRIQQGDKTRTQYFAAELTGITLNLQIAPGQFTRAALPANVQYSYSGARSK